ncbi:tyrosine-protein phosphatase [Carboxydothermus hydrogenoformans]|uniref:protein-tyrosine-phosphatase n=1 Tax=Carboxydothermus hydrogenoformans (strain ATCC BAA-161 / DSM 6008 / Z-2901) TaxID=246194 RepID=Q3A9A9_CARHZ|nr:CpsB/CapC family capsule biosynthesis tyrosine phosphatase [Carboxydothermus hydrogenoformans]ABB15697.1 putative phosphoesterase [Carboxydothermus hydrogenoformans Z-2901]
MLDLHCHILPGVDDGPKTLEDSLWLAREMAKVGFSEVVATPHFMAEGAPLKPEEVIRKVEGLNQALGAEGIGLKVYPGMELYLTPELPELIAGGKVLGLKGERIYLIELPLTQKPPWLTFYLAEIIGAGNKVIIAHPERYRYLRENREEIEELLDMGVVFQVSLTSLLSGYFGEGSRKSARWFLEKGVLVGTDAHGPGSIRFLEEYLKPEVFTNNRRFFEGKSCEPVTLEIQGERQKKKSWFKFF